MMRTIMQLERNRTERLNTMNQPAMDQRQPHRFELKYDQINGVFSVSITECPGVDVGGCTEFDPDDRQLHPERGCVLASWIDNEAVDIDVSFTFDGVLRWHDDESPYIETIEQTERPTP